MARPAAVDPAIPLTVHVPAEAYRKMTIHLFSELEGRVPRGAYASFLGQLIRAFFSSAYLDISEHTMADAGTYVVHGNAETLEILKSMLERP